MTEPSGVELTSQEKLLLEIEEILDRRTEIPALEELVRSLSKVSQASIAMPTTKAMAIAIDSSAMLRLNRGRYASDTIDYLRTSHPVPLILPGQAIQEFWNNQLSVVSTLASKVNKEVAAVISTTESFDISFGPALERLRSEIASFHSEFAEIYDDSTIANTIALLDVFSTNGVVHFIPRLRFAKFSNHRQMTKTPPGFKDAGDGDFFVWLDILYSLGQIRSSYVLEGVAIVTQDVKADWQRHGIAHPVLGAELRRVVDVPLHFWTVDQLHKYVQEQLLTLAPVVADLSEATIVKTD
jgi:hypothetical protein